MDAGKTANGVSAKGCEHGEANRAGGATQRAEICAVSEVQNTNGLSGPCGNRGRYGGQFLVSELSQVVLIRGSETNQAMVTAKRICKNEEAEGTIKKQRIIS